MSVVTPQEKRASGQYRETRVRPGWRRFTFIGDPDAEGVEVRRRERKAARPGTGVGAAKRELARAKAARRRREAKESPRQQLERAKARRRTLRGEHPGSDAAVPGEHGTPRGRYSDSEIEVLGKKGLALKKQNGRGYHYPIVSAIDVSHAVTAWGRAKPSERVGVRGWIIKRARILGATDRLPASWITK